MRGSIIKIVVLVLSVIIMDSVMFKDAGGFTVNDLSEFETDYVGDTSNVVGIASNQQYPKGYAYKNIEIQSEEEPYGLTVYLEVSEEAEGDTADFEYNANTTLELIKNLGTVRYVNCYTDELIASFSK